MLKSAVPLFHISNTAAAVEFCCGRLGFHLEFAHRAYGVTTAVLQGRDEGRCVPESFLIFW